MRKVLSTFALISLISASAASADVLVSNLAGTTTSNFGSSEFFGQSFTSGSDEHGYTLDTICLLGNNGASHVGNGTLYLYSQAFTGTASNLGTGTGYLATSTYTATGDAGWDFTGIILDPNATYYFYVQPAASFDVGRTSSNNYSGGTYYYAYASSATFSDPTSGTIDLNFSVNGTVVPEPSTMAGFAGLAALGFVALKRRKLQTRAVL
jgi:hypothetical protein